MADIYRQHETAFAQVSAYVVLKDGERVATIAFKFPRDGAGRLYAYVHWLGIEMVRGSASGCGYDKKSAACANAARHLPLDDGTHEMVIAMSKDFANFRSELERDDGYYWDRRLRNAGFEVLQAV